MPRYSVGGEDVLPACIEVDVDGLNLYVGGDLILFIDNAGVLQRTAGNTLTGLKWDSEGRIQLDADDREAIAKAWLEEKKMKAVKK